MRTLATSVTKVASAPPLTADADEKLLHFIQQHPRLVVLTGAGVSTDSGIPDYRDARGEWKQKQPVQHQAFMTQPAVRQRYWARSLPGWPVIRDAQPSGAHFSLAEMERNGHLQLLVTQNVDRLHQKAGSHQVTDLHGRSDQVICMACHYRTERDEVHKRSAEINPEFAAIKAIAAPDGDAHVEMDFSQFRVPDCPKCGGILKPDVVFFGDNVPKERVESSLEALKASDGLLVIGSSLMVFSGFRFCRRAAEWGIPIATLSLGRTRADELSQLQINAPIRETLEQVCGVLGAS
ncbi:NAD-dependent protein deacetylase [Nitrincola sp.]|uniref:NAD-dependent protein deacetylase n=1 Tax=Nitrincola sp. TaxID=1926584 RepID=UPI003A95569A